MASITDIDASLSAPKCKPEETGGDCHELEEGLQAAVDQNRAVLEVAASSPLAQSWLKPRLDTPEGTWQLYGIVEKMVSGPSFLAKIIHAKNTSLPQPEKQGYEVLQPEFWEPPQDRATPMTDTLQCYEEVSVDECERIPVESIDSYVMVEKEDVLDAIGTFVAAYLADLPQAQHLRPEELQVAIIKAFKDLRKSKMQKLWAWGRAIYRCIAFSYGAFSVYENPWLVRACLAALFTASKMMIGLLI